MKLKTILCLSFLAITGCKESDLQNIKLPSPPVTSIAETIAYFSANQCFAPLQMVFIQTQRSSRPYYLEHSSTPNSEGIYTTEISYTKKLAASQHVYHELDKPVVFLCKNGGYNIESRILLPKSTFAHLPFEQVLEIYNTGHKQPVKKL